MNTIGNGLWRILQLIGFTYVLAPDIGQCYIATPHRRWNDNSLITVDHMQQLQFAGYVPCTIRVVTRVAVLDPRVDLINIDVACLRVTLLGRCISGFEIGDYEMWCRPVSARRFLET